MIVAFVCFLGLEQSQDVNESKAAIRRPGKVLSTLSYFDIDAIQHEQQAVALEY